MRLILSDFDRLFSLGRNALYWGIKYSISSLDKIVWVPAFHCGVEVQAILDAGLEVGFYKIRQDLSIDENDLEKKLAERPGPVMIIHYFGFAQPSLIDLVGLCTNRNVMLIEDCSHALFSTFKGNPLGQFGHFSIYSLYKSLGLCDGGALLMNYRQFGDLPIRTLPKGRPSLYGYKIQMRDLIKKALRPWLTSRLQATLSRRRRQSMHSSLVRSNAAPNARLQSGHDYRGGMSLLSKRLASTIDPALIIKARRENWQYLQEHLAPLAGYRNVYSVLEEGVCPLYFPIWTSRREDLQNILLSKNIESFIFGRYPHPLLDENSFPEVRTLRERILCLPLDQYMDKSDLDRLVEAATPFLGKHEQD